MGKKILFMACELSETPGKQSQSQVSKVYIGQKSRIGANMFVQGHRGGPRTRTRRMFIRPIIKTYEV